MGYSDSGSIDNVVSDNDSGGLCESNGGGTGLVSWRPPDKSYPALFTQFAAAAAKGDGAVLAALYSKQGQVMFAGSDPIRGTNAIQKF